MEGEKKEFNGFTLIIENIPFSTTSDDLKKVFSQFGKIIDIKIDIDKFTKRSKGRARLIFADETSAKEAIKEMNSEEFQGRKISVKVSGN